MNLDGVGCDAVGDDLQVSRAGWRGGRNLDGRVHDVMPGRDPHGRMVEGAAVHDAVMRVAQPRDWVVRRRGAVIAVADRLRSSVESPSRYLVVAAGGQVIG